MYKIFIILLLILELVIILSCRSYPYKSDKIVQHIDKSILISEPGKKWSFTIKIDSIDSFENETNFSEYYWSSIIVEFLKDFTLTIKSENNNAVNKEYLAHFPESTDSLTLLKYKQLPDILVNNLKCKIFKNEYNTQYYHGIKIDKKHVIIIFIYDNTFIMVHLSKLYYTNEDQKVFDEIINSIQIVSDE